jgi:hypothetical protein
VGGKIEANCRRIEALTIRCFDGDTDTIGLAFSIIFNLRGYDACSLGNVTIKLALVHAVTYSYIFVTIR